MARRIVKILHELSAIGMTGALAAHMILLWTAPTDSLTEYATVRRGIEAITGWLLVPSLLGVLVSGLLSMMVYTPFLNASWVWWKAALGLPMFEGTLITIDAMAQNAAKLANEAEAKGVADMELLETMVRAEWRALWMIMALCVAQTVIGVWRPRKRRKRASDS